MMTAVHAMPDGRYPSGLKAPLMAIDSQRDLTRAPNSRAIAGPRHPKAASPACSQRLAQTAGEPDSRNKSDQHGLEITKPHFAGATAAVTQQSLLSPRHIPADFVTDPDLTRT